MNRDIKVRYVNVLCPSQQVAGIRDCYCLSALHLEGGVEVEDLRMQGAVEEEVVEVLACPIMQVEEEEGEEGWRSRYL